MQRAEKKTERDTIHSVGELTQQIKELLEGQILPCWVRGEVSNLRQQSSGHIYFTLKDKDSQISAVLFRGNAIQQSLQLKDGLQILAYGEISVYLPRGSYQLICRHVMHDGVGRLQLEFERLKKKLQEEGLFDAKRKKKIPILPRVIAVITSPTGAAIQDFLSILARRNWGGRIIILPAKVQGQGAAEEIEAQIKRAETLPGLDLLVLARGGGSLEDLWCFNEERVARALAACSIPTISAVGHEIDFTLSDFVADLRAETPSAAAELISSAYIRCTERLRIAAQDLFGLLATRIEQTQQRIDSLQARLKAQSPARRLEFFSLRLDELAGRLSAALNAQRHQRHLRFSQALMRFRSFSPQQRLALMRLQVDGLAKRLREAPRQDLSARAQVLHQLNKRLEGVSLHSVLKRGFTLVRDESGALVTRKKMLKNEQSLSVEFVDGLLQVRAVIQKN